MQPVTFTAFWLRRIAGALYATLPDRRVNAAVLLGLAWKKLTLRLRAAFFMGGILGNLDVNKFIKKF